MERLTTKNIAGVAVYKHPFECERCGEAIWRLPDYGNGSPTEKLADYEDAEEQGLLLRLPCKVGDTVYFLDRFCAGYASDCPSRPCENCPDYKLEIYEGNFMLNNICDFGKTVFLTREEAKAKLKEMEEKDA